MINYVSEYQINTAIDNIANSVLSGKLDSCNDITTLTYYGMKIRGGLDKLFRLMPTVPMTIEHDIKQHIDKLQEAMRHISDLIKNLDGTGSLYFSNLTEDQNLVNHPIVRLLEDTRLKGMAMPRAITITSISTGIPELAVSNFINQHDIKYPNINETSEAYIKGQDDARSLAGTNLLDVGTRMHIMQKKYLRAKDNVEPEDSNSYIAGFSSMLSSNFSQSFIKSESDKAKLLAFK